MSSSASQGAAAADAGEGLAGAVTRHVTNYDGTYVEAVEDGLIEKAAAGRMERLAEVPADNRHPS